MKRDEREDRPSNTSDGREVREFSMRNKGRRNGERERLKMRRWRKRGK